MIQQPEFKNKQIQRDFRRHSNNIRGKRFISRKNLDPRNNLKYIIFQTNGGSKSESSRSSTSRSGSSRNTKASGISSARSRTGSSVSGNQTKGTISQRDTSPPSSGATVPAAPTLDINVHIYTNRLSVNSLLSRAGNFLNLLPDAGGSERTARTDTEGALVSAPPSARAPSNASAPSNGSAPSNASEPSHAPALSNVSAPPSASGGHAPTQPVLPAQQESSVATVAKKAHMGSKWARIYAKKNKLDQ